MADVRDAFWERLRERHLANLTHQEFTRAVRALSVRYVERRQSIAERSPLDSAGKRAAFALFYAPLHFWTVSAAVERVNARLSLSRIVDLGCGTGVCSAAWALACPEPRPALEGIDLQPWVIDEARWNWRELGLSGRASRGDASAALEKLLRWRAPLDDLGIVTGWTANELAPAVRDRTLDGLRESLARGASVLLIEPLARGVAPWWDEWAASLSTATTITGDFKFDVDLPDGLLAFAESAGLSARPLGARVLFTPGRAR